MDASPTVLIVDDDPELCDVVQMGLGQQGMTVIAKKTGAEGFAVVGQQDFDCVITDLDMPGMHGFELIERIVANRPELPVIVLTGSGDFATAIGAMRAGAYDFVTKPLDLGALVLAVKRGA